ncbi:MAG: DUF302 domain-containing protein [Candidatus Mcinerneyibacterium aminivorans]|jgi:uncharacterized protein (DUF302 family)|uniref:DUF302 domain-containing protein n=1 Tax=Candidatus Mcinerneyibacterium aminivorans TaxID=2703815 RepID=A0A5D0MLV3_9BACT|nr:MAG: DUF302 domain-containing protein [Candidatus Mcinerneyibacterium aminivorans]
MDYGFYKEVDMDFDKVITKIEELAKKHSFGVLTRVNVDEKFKEKLGLDYKKYTILGLCNPKNAHKALEIEENIGLMLPCNAVIYEKNNKTAVAVIKPSKMLKLAGNNKLVKISEKIEKELKNIIKEL